MCTFNNISIKLTCAVCIFCRMNHVIFTSFLCFFFSRALHADFFSSSFSWCFSLCSRLDHLLPFFSHSYSIHCRLLSIGNRDIFIRFEFRLHSVSCVRSILFAFSLSLSLSLAHSDSVRNGKAHLDVAFLTNQSDIQSVRICKCMSSKSSSHIQNVRMG